MGVGKNTKPVKTPFPDEVIKFKEGLLAFTRVTGHHGGTQGHVRNLLSKSLKQLLQFMPTVAPAHSG
jgi:hypothetical protein